MDIISKITSIGESMRQDSASLKEALLEDTLVTVTDHDLPDGVSRLIYNHAITKTALGQDVFQLSKATYLKKISQAIEDGVISEPIYHNRSHLFTLDQVHKLMNHYGFEKYSDNYDSVVVEIANYKGGVGKSTTTLSLAVATALDLDLNSRVCLVDLDPQGSSARGIINVQNEHEELFITVGDLLCYEQEPESEVAQLIENGNSFEDIVKAAPFSTHLPNLDVITAFPTDEKFTDCYWELEEDKREAWLTNFSQNIIPILKEQYDIIYLDLPPQNSPITWSATEAADMIITPIAPRTYDYASTTSFMLTLAEVMEDTLPSKGQNIQWIKMLPVNYNENNRQEKKTFDRLLRTVGGTDMFIKPIKHSPLFLEAASMNRTIFDIRKSESTCSSLQYDLAYSSVVEVYKSFINELKVVAAK